MVPDIADPGIACGQDRPVRKSDHDPGAVPEAAAVRVVCPGPAVRCVFHQTAAVGTHPQMVRAVHIHAADTLAVQRRGQFILDLMSAGLVHHVQALVGADVIAVLPRNDGVDHPAVHADSAVYVLEGGFGQPQEAEPGGGEPKVALIVAEHVVDGVVEIIGVHPVITGGVYVGYAAVGGDEQGPVAQIVQVVDVVDVLAGHDVQQAEVVVGDVIAKNAVGGSAYHQRPIRREGAAVELILPVREHQGALDVPFLHQEKPPVGGDGRYMSELIGGDAVCIVYFLQGIGGLQAVVHHQDLQAAGGTDVIISVGSPDDAPYGIGGKAAGLVEYVHHLFADHDGQSVVVGADPQAAFLVHIEAVHVFDGFIIVHPAELPPVVAVESGVGADPEDAVVGLGDTVGFAAGQAVGAAVNALDVIVVIDRFGGARRPGGGGEGKPQGQAQDHRRRPCAEPVSGPGVAAIAAPAPDQDHQIHSGDDDHLVDKFQRKLAKDVAQEGRPFLVQKKVDDAVAPLVSGIAGGEQQV